jgi:uncharacterized protein DUF5336
MTYSPGSPGYPPAQPGGSYAGATLSFAKDDDGESKLPLISSVAVAVLGFLAYLASFGPLATVNVEIGGAGAVSGAGTALGVIATLLAGLLAAAGLLPKARSHAGVVAAIAVLGALLVVSEIVNMGSGVSIGWGLWLILVFSVLQAIAAVYVLLLDAGVVTAPKPRPKHDPYAQYGQYGQQYGQYGQYAQQPYYGQPGPQQFPGPQAHGAQQPAGHQDHSAPQPAGYGPQYGGYPSSHTPAPAGPAPSPQSQAPTQVSIPTTMGGGFGTQPGPQHAAHQQGTSTPPTGFPSFGTPPAAAADGTESGQADGAHHKGEEQSSPSSPSGPAAPE